MGDWLENITDKEILQTNLTFASLYIAIYEHMVDYVVSNLKSFLCDFEFKNGEINYIETDAYKNEIKNRIVDAKGNKDKTKASFLWLIDNGAITEHDYSNFIEAKKLRNKYAHELTTVIYQGATEQDAKVFFDMYALYQKISKWYFLNIEAVIMGYELPTEADLEKVQTTANVIFGLIMNVLYGNDPDKYKDYLAKNKAEEDD